jgi:hypothetical protein
VVVGVTYPDLAAIGAVFGKGKEAGQVDPKAWVQRIIDYVNKTGGIAGRPIRPVWYKADSGADASTAGQQACATFTQDNKVDFVINTGVGGDTLPTCLLAAKVAMINGPVTDTADMRRLPNAFDPDAIRLDRLFSSMVRLSFERGLIKKGDKLGVLIEDCPWGHRIFGNVLTPLAKQLGITLQEGTVHCISNIVTDLAPVTSDIQRETLRFATGTHPVTHVMVVSPAEAFIVAQFTKNASQQKYFPKYFLSSTAYPFNDTRKGATIGYADDAKANMTGYGVNPLLDVGPLTRPDTPGQKAAQEACLKADPKEGIYAAQKGTDGYWFSVGVIRGYCDAFFVLKAVLESNGVQFSLSAFAAGYHDVLNGKLSSTLNGGGFFRVPKDGTDGIGLLKPFAWSAGKGQFVYTGPAVPVP